MTFSIQPAFFLTAVDTTKCPNEYVRIYPEDYILILNHCLPEERDRIWSMMGSYKGRYTAVGMPLYNALADLRNGVYDCLNVSYEGT